MQITLKVSEINMFKAGKQTHTYPCSDYTHCPMQSLFSSTTVLSLFFCFLLADHLLSRGDVKQITALRGKSQRLFSLTSPLLADRG